MTRAEIHQSFSGGHSSQDQIDELYNIFGENDLKMNFKSNLTLLLDEFLGPFHIIQSMILIYMIFKSYLVYSLIVIMLTVI